MSGADWKRQLVAINREKTALAQRIGELERLLREEQGSTDHLRQILLQLKAHPQLIGSLAIQPPARTYADWIAQYDTPTEAQRQLRSAEAENLAARPLLSLLLPLPASPERLQETIAAIRRQSYSHWELFLAGDRSPELGSVADEACADPRVRLVSEGTQAALAATSGDFVSRIEAGTVPAEDAFYWLAKELAVHPGADLVFGDEDRLDDADRRQAPNFKPDWNPALMLGQDAVGRLAFYRRELVARLGGWRGLPGAEGHDLALRVADASAPARLRHIPRILCHVRGSAPAPEAWESARRAIQDHLERRGIRGTVERRLAASHQIAYAPPDRWPRVTVIVPTTLRNPLTQDCLRSVLARTAYPDWEIVLAMTKADAATARATEGLAASLADPRVQVMEYDRSPFNYSWVNNRAAERSTAEFLCFLNDDVEATSPDWLEQLVLRGKSAGVGAVGAMLYFPNGAIQHAGVILGVGGVADHAGWGWPRGSEGYFQRAALEQDFSAVTAACMLTSRELFLKMGAFDESFPYSYNDVDYCLRLRRDGLRVLWTPRSELTHHESLTFGPSTSPERQAEFTHAFQEMQRRWGRLLELDPFYNPNLTLASRQAFLQPAFPPRID